MGLVYSKSESQNLIRVMEGNLAKAGSILQSLTQASKQLTSVLTVELKGQAYSSGLAVFDDIILPTMQHASTAIEELSQGLSSYRALDSAMPNEILDEDNLNEQIRIRQNMVSSLHHQSRLLQYQQGGDDLVSQTNLLHHLTSHMLVLEEEIRQLQEKVRKLGEFSSSTSGLFTAGQNYLLASLRGVNILKHATVDPQTGAYLLRGGVSLLDLQVQGVGDDFQSKLQKMSLAEIEEKYGNIIRVNVNSVYIGAGFDSRYAGTKLSPKEIDAIRARYQYLKARGDLTLQQIKDLQAMYANLKSTDKEAIDSMSLEELTSKYSYLLLPRLGMDIPYALADPAGKAKKDYLYHRFEELMAQELIDWRDPQYMEKLNAYVNKTGLDPRTGLEASDDVKLVAKYYGWVKGSSTTAASIIGAFIDFSEITGNVKTPSVSAYTNADVTDIINRRGYSIDDFLYLTDADSVLSAKQTAIVRDIRLQIGLPDSDTRMAKIIPTKYVEGIVQPNSRHNTVSGFVSVDSHSASLKTLDEVFEGNRLDYKNTPYNLQTDETYSKINFTLDSKMRLDIPLQEPKVGEYPFTGRGFTGSQNIVLPEYELRKGANYHFQHGDTIGVYDSKSGNLVKQYIYDGKQKQWLLQ